MAATFRNAAVFVCMVVSAASVMGASINAPETWNQAGALKGWTVDNSTVTLGNPNGYLDAAFRDLSGPPTPEACNVAAPVTIAYTGDYPADGVTSVGFDLLARNATPSSVKLAFRSPLTQMEWHVMLPPPAPGKQRSYDVPMQYSAGWQCSPDSTKKDFDADVKNVSWVGVSVMRSGGTNVEHYCVDNFTLLGSGSASDRDADGMTDYREARAGTDPDDQGSALVAGIEQTGHAANGVVITWSSVANKIYGITTARAMKGVFEPLASGIPATPPMNVYTDSTAIAEGPYFYKVNLEQ